MDVLVELRASITEFQARMAEAKGELDGLAAKGDSTSSKLASIGKGLTLGIGGAAIAIGAASVKMADDFEASHARLTAALSAAGINYDKVKGSISQTDAAAAHYGFTSAQVEGALGLGIISTQNYGKAHQNLQVALQLAAAKHIDLSSAMGMVDKAAQGQLRPLKALGIDLPVTATSAAKLAKAHDAVSVAQQKVADLTEMGANKAAFGTKAFAAYAAAQADLKNKQQAFSDQQKTSGTILDDLSQRLKGQAAASADTFGGRVAAAKAQAEDMGTSIGMALIPKLEDLMTDVQKTVQWFEKHKDVAKALGIALGSIGAVLVGAYGIQAFKNLTSTVKDSVDSLGKLFSKITGSSAEVEGDLQAQGGAAEEAQTQLQTAATEMSASMTTLQSEISAAVGGINVDLASIGSSATAAVAEANTAFASLTSESVAKEIGPINEKVSVDGKVAADEIGTAMKEAGIKAGSEEGAGEVTGAKAAGGELGAGEVTGAKVAGAEVGAGEATGGKVAGEEEAAAITAAGKVAAGEIGAGGAAGGGVSAGEAAAGGGILARLGLTSLSGLIPWALAAGGVGQIASGKATGHKPNMGDIMHPSQWTVDAGHFGASGLLNALSAVGLNIRAPVAGPAMTANQRLTAQIAAAPTLEGKLDIVNAAINARGGALAASQSWLKHLGTEGTLSQSKTELANLKHILGTEKTLGLSKGIQDQTKGEIVKVQHHIDQLNATNRDIAQDKSVISAGDRIRNELQTVGGHVSTTNHTLDGGIAVKKLPSMKSTINGNLQLTFK